MDAVLGTWKMKKGTSKNFDVLLKAMGIPDEAVDVYLKRDVRLTWSKEGDKFTLAEVVTNDPNKLSASFTYELDKEFDTLDIDGYPFKMLVTWDGSKFIETYSYADGSIFKTERETVGNLMKARVTAKDITASEEFEKC